MKDYQFGTGRRKTSISQVRIFKGTGKVEIVSKGEVTDPTFISSIKEPLALVGKENAYDISIKLSGGGKNSQIEATKLGVARAISKVDEDSEKMMKKEGFLTRDPREKERKKPGLRRARRAPQWAKR